MNNLNVLHLCSFFYTSSLYKNLFETLEKKGIHQEVLIPLYTNNFIKRQDYENQPNLIYNSEKICSVMDRYFLKKRLRKIVQYILKNYSLEDYNMLHAHSLLANGGACYELYKRGNNIRYIAAVRMTDLEVLQKLPWYKNYAMDIVKNSCNIIFISETLKKRFVNLLKINDKEILSKFIVIPNGILDFWYEECNIEKKNIFTFIYQGSFLPRKNIIYSIDIIKNLTDLGVRCCFDIYGGEHSKQKKILEQYINNQGLNEYIHLREWTSNVGDIKKKYSESNVFIMPSKNETFGISYIEALACGIPVVYLQNDGIDGMLDDRQGIALKGDDISEDTKRILKLINNYDIYIKNTKNITFKWKDIANKYVEIYQK